MINLDGSQTVKCKCTVRGACSGATPDISPLSVDRLYLVDALQVGRDLDSQGVKGVSSWSVLGRFLDLLV